MTDLNRILLVEDSAPDVELTMAALQEHKLANEVVVARDGAEALDFLFRRGAHAGRSPENPVVILLDLKMPRVDGFEVLQQIKSDPRLKLIPVVILTSSREERDLRRAYSLGVNGYAVKSIDFVDYRERLHTLIKYWASVNEQPIAAASLDNR